MKFLADAQIPWWRLGAVAGDTIGHAGYKRPSSHEMFCGVTPAIVSNHLLYAAHCLIFGYKWLSK